MTALKFKKYTTTIEFTDRIVGGIPIVLTDADKEKLYTGWLKGQGVEAKDAGELAGKLADDPDMPEAEETAIGFRRDDQGLYVEARQVKAMLKEAAQRLGIVKQVRGSRQVLQHDLHVRNGDGTQKLHLGVLEPTGIEARPISVITPQGPRTSLKAFEYVTGARLSFTLLVLDGGVGDGLIDADRLRQMLDLGGYLGLGADRSQGEGTFWVASFAEAAK